MFDAAGMRQQGQVWELAESLEGSPYYNRDLAPTPASSRSWTTWNIAALWIGIAVCIPTWSLAAGMISHGMSWWQALLTILLGNLLVLVPMCLVAHAGTKYGIPFPVLLRAPFGVAGSNVAALLRAAAAIGGFGVLTWVGGEALYRLMGVLYPERLVAEHLRLVLDLHPHLHRIIDFGMNSWEALCVLLFWLINVFVLARGMESIRWLMSLAAPFLVAVGVVILSWAVRQPGHALERARQLQGPMPQEGLWAPFGRDLLAMIAVWAVVAVNIPDFTRFARTQRSQVVGQLLGLPATMALFSFIGVVATCAAAGPNSTSAVTWDPVKLLLRFHQPWAVALSMLAVLFATLTTNVAVNGVASANAFSSCSPTSLRYRHGVWITSILAIVAMLACKVMAVDRGTVQGWIDALGLLLGPVVGIVIADYYVVRRTQLRLPDLYKRYGIYRYCGGTSLLALFVLVAAVAPSVPGFLVHSGCWSHADLRHFVHEVGQALSRQWDTDQAAWCLQRLYRVAWAAGLGIAFALYSLCGLVVRKV